MTISIIQFEENIKSLLLKRSVISSLKRPPTAIAATGTIHAPDVKADPNKLSWRAKPCLSFPPKNALNPIKV